MSKKQIIFSVAFLILLWFLYSLFGILRAYNVCEYISPIFVIGVSFCIFSAALNKNSLRSGWILTAIGISFWAVADILWVVYKNFLGFDPEESVLLTLLYTMPNVLFFVGILITSFQDRRRWTSFQFLVDMCAISISVCGFIYFTVFYAQFMSLFKFDLQSVIYFITLVIDMLILSFVFSLYFSMSRKNAPFFVNLVFIGLVSYASLDIFYTYALFRGIYVPNGVVDIGFLFCLFIFAVAALSSHLKSGKSVRIHSETYSSKDLIIRTLILVGIPLAANLFRPLAVAELLFFCAIIVLHQAISQIIRRLLIKDSELEDNSRKAEYLEATVDERTRELRVMNQTLENLIKRDAITGQYNRKYFLELIDEWIETTGSGEKIWLMIIDFDRFKSINDTYGHDVGDSVLRYLGKRLETISNERTIFARLGGDEFGIACVRGENDPIHPLIHTIGDLCNIPIVIGNFTIHIGLSIGVSSWPEDARTRSDLMRHADIAMYVAKTEHHGGVSFFDSALIAGIDRSNRIDLTLLRASLTTEFYLVYQPQFSVDGVRLVGMEALVRWNSSELGFVAPDEFIPIAEENGIITPLSDWIMLTALRQIAEWNTRYSLNLLMGINVSPRQLDDVNFLNKLEAGIDECKVLPEWINIEITERSAMKGEAFLVGIFNRLASLNISSSIDDFGTGYSSLSYLKEFDIEYLKIAKELIDGIATNENSAQIVHAIIMIATALKLKTIAEGVESENQVRMLSALGCDEIQGYYYGKPVLPDEFEELYLNKRQF